MANSTRELQSNMRHKEDEGMAPIQSLAFTDPQLIPREVDRLYPAEFERNRDSEKEGKMMLKYSLDTERFGQKFLEKEDVDYIYNKGKEQEMMTFDAWYASLFDHSDPAQLELSRRVNPGWFDRRMRAIDKSLDMQRRVAKIKLFGIQDKEDVMTTYVISTGRINPSLYMTNFINPQKPAYEKVDAQYQRGVFAPRTHDDFIRPVPQPVGPAMPLDYTGAFAHTGFLANEATMKGYMQGTTDPMPPGDPAMMSTIDARALRARDPTRGVPGGVNPAEYYTGGVAGLPKYDKSSYRRNYEPGAGGSGSA